MNQLSHSQIAELVVQAQQGNQDAFATIYTATVDRQLYFASAFLKDRSLAEDAVQDVYVKIFRSIDKIKDPKLFVAYLNRTCYHMCVDYSKKSGVQKYELNDEALLRIEDGSPDSMPSDHLEIKETNKELYDAIGELPAPNRTAFLLRYYYDFKIREIADQMDISESSVKRAIKAATERLQPQLLSAYNS